MSRHLKLWGLLVLLCATGWPAHAVSVDCAGLRAERGHLVEVLRETLQASKQRVAQVEHLRAELDATHSDARKGELRRRIRRLEAELEVLRTDEHRFETRLRGVRTRIRRSCED